MARSTRESVESSAFWREKAVLNRYQGLADSAQVRMRRERLPSRVHPSNDRILDGDHACLGLTFVHGACSARKSREGDSLDRVPPDLRDRTFRVRPAITLEGDARREVALLLCGALESRSVFRRL